MTQSGSSVESFLACSCLEIMSKFVDVAGNNLKRTALSLAQKNQEHARSLVLSLCVSRSLSLFLFLSLSLSLSLLSICLSFFLSLCLSVSLSLVPSFPPCERRTVPPEVKLEFQGAFTASIAMEAIEKVAPSGARKHVELDWELCLCRHAEIG